MAIPTKIMLGRCCLPAEVCEDADNEIVVKLSAAWGSESVGPLELVTNVPQQVCTFAHHTPRSAASQGLGDRSATSSEAPYNSSVDTAHSQLLEGSPASAPRRRPDLCLEIDADQNKTTKDVGQVGVDLCKNLQEETSDSIMGYSPKLPQAPSPHPILLGRHNINSAAASHGNAALSQVKSRASAARKHQTLRAFLLNAGVSDPNGQKSIGRGLFRKRFTYPLHMAVAANDADAVEVLLWGGARKSEANSERLTPLDLARKLDKRGSMQQVIALLED
mmetsp:Transcript_127413/g.366414  ORF Transcript_127413/g.366414 Transcript_127413/m.366414 type:complete len:277 (-) Transcript_127413:91-921(-)